MEVNNYYLTFSIYHLPPWQSHTEIIISCGNNDVCLCGITARPSITQQEVRLSACLSTEYRHHKIGYQRILELDEKSTRKLNTF